MQVDTRSGSGVLAAASETRRRFLKGAGLARGTVTASTVGPPRLAVAQHGELQPRQILVGSKLNTPSKTNHWYIPASDKTVHWGYFSKGLKPTIEIDPGDFVTVECLTHQASDDYDRMIRGDPGAESVYYWTEDQKNVNRRGQAHLMLQMALVAVQASTFLPAQFTSEVPSPGTSLRFGFSTCIRAPVQIRNTRERRLAPI